MMTKLKTIMTTMTMTMMTTTQRWPGWWQLQRLQQTRREPQRLPWFLPPTWLLTFTIHHHHDHHHHSRDHHHHLYGDGNSWSIFCNGNYYNSCCSPRQVTLPSTLIDYYLMILIIVTMVPQADDECGSPFPPRGRRTWQSHGSRVWGLQTLSLSVFRPFRCW